MLSLKNVLLLCTTGCALVGQLFAQADTYASGADDRAYTVATLQRIALPVLKSLAENRFKADFPQRTWEKDRIKFSHLEGYARTLSGVAPWLELGPDDTPEGKQRAEVIELALRATRNAFDPASPDCLSFTAGNQTLVESAYVALAMLRAPTQLWGKLSATEQTRVIDGLKQTRQYNANLSNWLMFSALREAFIWKVTGDYTRKPIEFALSKHQEWYVGDGSYGDGPDYHWDYYNSYVIHPMLVEVLKICREKKDPLGDLYSKELKRAQRYAVVLERMISPEGTYPVLGRSSTYRLANMQLLTQLILSGEAPGSLGKAPTRSALTAVTHRLFEAPGTFDVQGWLQIGVVGNQNNIHEYYNSTGALYITCDGFLHLGLPATHPFWTAPGGPWTQKRIWAGDPEAPSDGKLAE